VLFYGFQNSFAIGLTDFKIGWQIVMQASRQVRPSLRLRLFLSDAQ
jgi:hypothetical protein